MNNALIAIGGSMPALTDAARASARAIGKVVVDHGDTSCETPDAATYIDKTVARTKRQGGAAAAKAPGKARAKPASKRKARA